MIIKATLNDIDSLTKIALLLFKKYSFEELKKELSESFGTFSYFLYIINDEVIGFLSMSKRTDYVEGQTSTPVAYLEGIYIKEEYRLHGYAKELLSYAKEIAKEEGYKEFGSDCEITNEESLKFHQKMGFVEVNRVICFISKI